MTAQSKITAGAVGSVVLFTGPFGEPEREILLDKPMTIAEVIAANDLEFRLPTIAIMGDAPVMRGEWAVRQVRPGEVLGFVAVPGDTGGGGGAGKQIVGLVATIALAVAAPMIGGWVAGAFFGGSSIAAGLVTSLVLAGGSLLLNALFPPPEQTDTSPEPVYSARAASNRMAPDDVVPVLYGRMRYRPPFAARPYAEYEGNDQYLYQLFALTKGLAGVEKIEIGETELWNSGDGFSDAFSDVEIEIIEPGDDITLFPANVIASGEIAGQPVPDPPDMLGPFVVNAAGTEVTRLAVDFAFPGGLFEYDDNGTIKSHSVSLRAEYQRIDDNGDPVGGWSEVFASTYTRATRTPQRITRRRTVSPGRYRVRFLATSAFDDDDKVVNTVVWNGLRGYLRGFKTPENTTLLAIKIRANEQLSQQSASQISVTAQRHLPHLVGDSWVTQPSRSIAFAAADLLRNSDYSIGLPDASYDLAWLAAKHSFWEGRGDTFNAVFDRSWTLQQALRAVLRAGRAQPVRLGGKIGFTRLEPKHLKRAVFTPRNVVRGTFSHELVLFDEDKPDSIIGVYLDETIWDTRTVKAGLASVGSDAPARSERFGVTNHDQAWREFVTEAAINAFQREFVGFTSEWEGKLLVRGDPILVHHPFVQGVETVALRGLSGRTLTLDRPVSVEIVQDAYAIVRDKRGREWGPCLVESIDGHTVVLDNADFTAVQGQMGNLAALLPTDRSEPSHVIICDGEMRPFNGLVVAARPTGPDRVEVLAVADAPEVYLADGTEVMPSPWQPPTLPPAVPLRPIILGLNAELRASGAGMELDASWQPAPGAERYLAEVSYDGGESWKPVYEGSQNRFTVQVLPQVLSVRVAAIGTVQGPWVTRTFVAGEVPDIVVPNGWLDGIDWPNLNSSINESMEALFGNVREILRQAQELALFGADETLGNWADHQTIRRELSSVYETSRAEYTEAITTATGPGSAIVQRFELLEAEAASLSGDIAGLGSGFNALTVQVQANGDDIDVLSQTITVVESQIANQDGEIAGLSSGVSLLSSQVSSIDGEVTALADLVDALDVSVGDISASVLLAATAQAGPGGGWASWGVKLATGAGDQVTEAAFSIENHSTLGRRAVFDVDGLFVRSGPNGDTPFIWQDGKLRVKAIAAGSIDAAELFLNGVVITDAIAESAISDTLILNGPEPTITSFQTIVGVGTQTLNFQGKAVTGMMTVSRRAVSNNIGGVNYYLQRRFGTSGPWESLFSMGEPIPVGNNDWRRIALPWTDADQTLGNRQYRMGVMIATRFTTDPLALEIGNPELVTDYRKR